jgi:COMPASS component BRE2
MADAPSTSRAGTPGTAVLKHQLDDHAPSVSSPLNPDAAARSKAPAREKREKKDSLKKREAAGLINTKSAEPPSKKRKLANDAPAQPSPTRYNHPLPKEAFHYHVREPAFASHEPEPLHTPGGTELKRPLDQYV